MANKGITQLQDATALTGSEVVPLVQNGITKKASAQQIANLATTANITVSNDTATTSSLFPLFVNTTSGSVSTLYTSNPKYTFRPDTGELSSPEVIANNGLLLNANTINNSYTIAASNNALSAGPVAVAGGVVVTTSPGSVWTVV